MKKTFLAFISGVLLTLTIGAGASILYSAKEIEFNPGDEEWNVNNVEDALKSLYKEKKEKESLVGDDWSYDYVGKSEKFTAPVSGTYKLETWGAQGGNATYASGYKSATGGYGAYSVAELELEKGEELYVTVGGQGNEATISCSIVKKGNGYNGGSGTSCQGKVLYDSRLEYYLWGSGSGGATHIALESGELSTFEKKQEKVIIVSGGGGGAHTSASYYNSTYNVNGGHAGGYVGNSGDTRSGTDMGGTGGTQSEGGTYISGAQPIASDSGFGVGCKTIEESTEGALKIGGGAGWYGGGCGRHAGGGGGSSYIGYSKLENAKMVCYNCTTSTGTSTKTDSNTCVNGSPKENCSKTGNGYARITLIEVN